MWLNDHFKNFLFPEGIVIDPNDRIYWISDLNPVFGLIHLFTGVYDGENKKRTGRITDQSCLVDNSIEISNISLTPKDLIDTHHIMTLIMKSWTTMILISPHPINSKLLQNWRDCLLNYLQKEFQKDLLPTLPKLT